MSSSTYTDEFGTTSDLLWLDDAGCATSKYGVFFVEAGHAIDDETLKMCQRCPVRKHCVAWAYSINSTAGYFGGLSPSQRRTMTLQQALDFIDQDRPSSARV